MNKKTMAKRKGEALRKVADGGQAGRANASREKKGMMARACIASRTLFRKRAAHVEND
jgi:hypothetical protein